VLQGKLPTSVFEDDFKPPAAGYTLRSFLPDEICDGVKAIQVETDVVPGKDLHYRFTVRCVDANVACEVRGLCEVFCKAEGSQLAVVFPSMKKAGKSLRSAVQDRCFVLRGTLPASTFGGDFKTAIRGFLPDDVCEGIKNISIKAQMDPGKDGHLQVSIPCADDGIAYEVRGYCAMLTKAMGAGDRQWAKTLKSFQGTVKGGCFVWRGTLPAHIFQDALKEATCRHDSPKPATSGSQGPQTVQTPRNPRQEALCNLSQTYLQGFQQGLTDPANQEEAGRRLLERARECDAEFPRDAKLNEAQRMFRDLSNISEQGFLQAAGWQEMDPKQKADEERWLKQLDSEKQGSRMLAIYALTAMHSKKAAPGILRIAADRKEKDDADRQAACRALGILGDLSVVPDLVSLTYHYDRDTRFWAQISLVRLSGENFGRDVAAWRQWWQKQGGKPPIAAKAVAWATRPETLRLADPKAMKAADRQILDMAKKLSPADGKTAHSSALGAVSREAHALPGRTAR
jgi:hypothetical protein